ncbi:hypothetical protein BDR22DRAFT_881108 [Usnea florida]
MSNFEPKFLRYSCSDAGLGAALAIAFSEAGLHVYATARNSYKIIMSIQTAISTAMCVSRMTDLDVLVNNAGGAYSMPFSDLSIPQAKQLFDLTAIAVFPNSQSLKLEPFGIIVVDLKTGLVTSELYRINMEAMLVSSTKDSIYEPAMAVADKSMRKDNFEDSVVLDLSRKRSQSVLRRGPQAGLARIGTILLFGMLDATIKKTRTFDVAELIIPK